MTNRPTVYMMVGIPGSGKSYWSHLIAPNAVRLSTDDYIEAHTDNYDRDFKQLYPDANTWLNTCLSCALHDNVDVVWDQMNIDPVARRRKLANFPANYKKVAVFVNTLLEDALTNNENRSRTIPSDVIVNMHRKLVKPSVSEGFDEVIIIERRTNNE